MSVGKLCEHNVATVEADASIAEAATLMREAHVGALVVVEHSGSAITPVGMVTDRDLVIEVLAEGVDPRSINVGDIMTSNVVTVREDNGLEFALKEMHRTGARRLPVVDENDALIGILSVDAVIQHIAHLTRDIAEAFRLEQYRETSTRP